MDKRLALSPHWTPIESEIATVVTPDKCIPITVPQLAIHVFLRLLQSDIHIPIHRLKFPLKTVKIDASARILSVYLCR